MARFRSSRAGRAWTSGWRGRTTPGMWVSALAISLLSLLAYADYRVRPMVQASARAIAMRAATVALNDAINGEIASDAEFDKIVQIDTAAGGKMAAAHVNFAAVTDIQAAATKRADQVLHGLSETTLRLPWTQVVGGTLFTTFAPNIPVRMTFIGDAHSAVVMETKTVGVNQSVHTVYLDITADVNVIAPFVSGPLAVHSRVPIAYVVLAGEVPNTFVGAAGGVLPYVAPGAASPGGSVTVHP